MKMLKTKLELDIHEDNIVSITVEDIGIFADGDIRVLNW